MIAVALDGVTIAVAARPVLADVSLGIAPGEFVAMLGPNGAGKTTLMRAILGLVPLAAGRIAVFGASPDAASPRVGYMPQRQRITAERLRGRDVVASALDGRRWGLPWPAGGAGRARVDWALDLVDATALARRRLSEMSGGERQRLLLAQALLARPRLLLLDEPMTSLDPTHQAAVVRLADRARHELGATVIMSAHEVTPLLGTIDRVLYLGHGHAALGTVDEVITEAVLSRLYGGPVAVVRAAGRVLVVAGEGAAVADSCALHA